MVLAATFRLVPDEPAVIRARLDEIRRWRREHQPLGIPSAGSVFRNPDADLRRRADRRLRAQGPAHRRRGRRRTHANWILNDQGGTATDVRRLAELVRATVERETGVRLVFEVVFLGDWGAWVEDGA